MSPQIDTSQGGKLLFSSITLAGLEDLGYKVDYAQADPFLKSDLSPSCVCTPGNLAPEENPQDYGGNVLGSEGRASAIAFGKSLLATYAEAESLGANRSGVLFILYRENGVAYSIMVTAD